MRTFLKLMVLILVHIGLHSCLITRPIERIPPANNKTYNVDYLFEHDGCKVYRFYDRGHYVYFTNCSGETVSLQKDSAEIRVVNSIRKPGSLIK